MCDGFYVKPTQTINVGQVSCPATSATKLLSANVNRRAVKISGGAGNFYLGTTSSVSGTTGYPWTSDPNQSDQMTINWQSDIWAYNTNNSAISLAYAEEVLE